MTRRWNVTTTNRANKVLDEEKMQNENTFNFK